MTGEPINNLPTIFDRLEEKGISWKFYVQNYEPRLTYRTMHEFPGNRASQITWVPVLNMDRFIDDSKYSSHIVDLDEYFEDLRNGTLPAVAYIAPSGPSEHPPSSIQAGQKFVRSLIQALTARDAWHSSVIYIAYGLAIALTTLLIAFAGWRSRRSAKAAQPDSTQNEKHTSP